MSTPFVLPQYQGSLYDLQRQQALANALMQNSLTPQQSPVGAPAGPYQVTGRVSPLAPLSQIGQALMSARLGQQASQGLNNLGQQQWGSLVSMLGGGAGGQSPQPVPGSGAVAGAGGDAAYGSDGGNGTSAAGGGGQPLSGVPAGAGGFNGGVGSSSLNPIGMNPGMAAMMMMQSPDKYWEAQAAAYKPADIVQQLRAAGIDPSSPLGRQVAQNVLAKTAAPDYVSGRPGGWMLNKTTGQMQWMPNVPQGGIPVMDANGQPTGAVTDQPGAAGVTGNMAYARAAGEGGALPYSGVDARGNPLPVTNRTAAATQNGVPGFTPFQNAVRQVESSGNPAAVNPASGAVGSMQTLPTTATNPGFGVRPAANNSPAELQRVGADYATAMQVKYGNDADAAVAYNWGPQNADKWIAAGRPWNALPAETKAYVGQVMTQQQNYGNKGGSAPAAGGAIYAAAPMGATTAANASQGAPSQQMATAYGSLSNADGAYQQSRDALTGMLALANKKGAAGAAIGVLPEGISTKISPDAAEYQKLHATYVASQGKALGASGTDQARATIDEQVPTYDKPQTAMVSGLNTQLNNLDMAHLKTQYLNPIYQQGDEKAYTTQNAAFDKNIVPSMMPVLQLQGPQQRAAVQAAIKANPALRSNFEWAFNNGMLK